MNKRFLKLQKPKLVLLSLILIVLIGCLGSAKPESMEDLIESEFPKITNSGKLFTIINFKSAGFKALREYKTVEVLPPLDSAWHGIYKKMDYEIRFYKNHLQAKEAGSKDAQMVSGKDGVVTGDVPWEDGAKDRRRCSRPPGQPHSGCNYTSKYGDYVIFENVVVMCEGKDKLESRTSCSNLLSSFVTP